MEKKKSTLAETAINSVEKVIGAHPGYRRAHARGAYYEAIFTPTGLAKPFTTAVHLQKQKTRSIVRLSDSSSNLKIPDVLSPIKGMSVQFQLPDGSITNLVSVTVPVFLTKTPEAFVEILRLAAAKPGLRDIINMVVKYPESKAALRIIKNMRPFISYSTSCYYPIHAFYFVNKHGEKQPVKYEWKPETPFSLKAKKEAAIHPANYLEEELDQQLPITFTLYATLGESTDPVNDPTVLWPEDRTKIAIGHLEIQQKIKNPDDNIMFDPTIVPEGIICTDDPILHFRPDVYAVSFERRSNGL